MEREESPQELRFVVVNDPAHDFDLTQEAIIGNEIVAVMYRVGWGSAEEWRVSFFLQQEGSQAGALSWETFQKITRAFAAFREEMKRETEPFQSLG